MTFLRPTAAATDWHEVAALYALLEGWRSTPALRVNRAFAVGRAAGPAAGLLLLEHSGEIDPSAYPYVFLVRGSLLAELGRGEEARQALALAEQHARNPQERAQIRAQRDKLGEPP
jgi:predicted RNA polymerase sigma factor